MSIRLNFGDRPDLKRKREALDFNAKGVGLHCLGGGVDWELQDMSNTVQVLKVFRRSMTSKKVIAPNPVPLQNESRTADSSGPERLSKQFFTSSSEHHFTGTLSTAIRRSFRRIIPHI